MAATLGLVLDCEDPDKPAQFWSAAIGYTTLGGAGSHVLPVDADGNQPKLLLQRVAEPKSGENRMYVDIETPTVDDAVEEHGNRWVVMADPEGHEFCVRNAGQAE